MNNKKFAVVIPLANESDTFAEFSSMLIDIFNRVKTDNSFGNYSVVAPVL